MATGLHTTHKHQNPDLNYEERKIIERLLRKNTPKKQIARTLSRNISTIRREIKRGSVEQRREVKTTSKKIDIPLYTSEIVYYADLAQRTHKQHRKNCGAKRKTTACRDFLEYVEQQAMSPAKWSLDAAAGRYKLNNPDQPAVTTQTLYRWVELGLTRMKNLDLPMKLRRRTHKDIVRQHKRLYGRSIDDRPAEVNDRMEFGHWEGDGIVGKNKCGHLITLVERKTGMGFLFNVGDRKACRVVEVLDFLENKFGALFPEVFKSITFDNGVEFANSQEMEKRSRTVIYYAHPYSSWERGTNENWNGIVRRFVPKGSSFDGLTDADMKRIQTFINTLPRRRFHYRSPAELFAAELAQIFAAA